MITKYKSGYIHTAYATDAAGSNFSVSAYDGALYIGTYTDANSTENADYSAYNWEPIADIVQDDADIAADYADDATTEVNDETADNEIETTDDTAGAVVGSATPTGDDTGTDDATDATADNVARLETAVQLNADSTTNTITNPNIISGTNNGAAGWDVSSGISVSTLSDPVYADTAISCARFTCSASGSHYAFFPSEDLAAALAEQTQNYTLSFDCRASTPFPAPVKVCDSAAGNTLLTFDNMDFTTDDNDYAGVWVHYSSTAVSSGGAAASQGVYFDLSNMPASASLDIANLKIEDGAIDTPWKMSAKEAGETANAAKTTAETAATTANNASTTATAAQTAATTAQTTATAAQNTATTAQNTATAAQTAAATAQTTADNAATAAADAAKTASNYITDETNGIFVHPSTSTTDGVKITDSVEIVRNGSTVSSFGDVINIGDTGNGMIGIGNGRVKFLYYTDAYRQNTQYMCIGYDYTLGGATVLYIGSLTAPVFSVDQYGEVVAAGGMSTDGNIISNGLIASRKSIQANNLKCGSVDITPTAAKTVTKKTITFNKSFDTTPVVVVTPNSGRPDICSATASNITTDGFTLYFYRTSTTTTTVMWFAFSEV